MIVTRNEVKCRALLMDAGPKVKKASPVLVESGAARHGFIQHFGLYRLCD